MLISFSANIFAVIHFAYASHFYHTLLNGEKFKGFLQVSPVGDDHYVISFNVSESDGNVRWGLYMSSAPYDMAMITENCRRARRSPYLLRDLPLVEKTVKGWQIIGHTVVLTNEIDVIACATVIFPGLQLLRSSFHAPPIEGHIHIIPIKDAVRILPDLKYTSEYDDEEPQKAIIGWSFVPRCDENISSFQDTDGNELGVDSRSAITVQVPQNFTFRMFALFIDGNFFACSPITNVEIRHVKRGRYSLSQAHYFEPVRSASDFSTGTLHIRDDCLDISTETVHKSFEHFYPTISIFGPESIALKSLVAEDSCGPLRPQFPRPAATAYYMYPIVGRLVLVDMDDRILLTGELRQIHESTATRATIQVSSEYANSTDCPQCSDGEKCRAIEDAAIIVGKDEPTVTLGGVFPWFQIGNARSIIVDLHYTKVCANVTLLMSGALSAHALVRQITKSSAPVVASIVVLEYPANNYTEALVNKHKVFSSVTAHSMPPDNSITSSAPCDLETLGPSKQKWWIDRLSSILSGGENDTTVIIGSKQLVTGIDSVIGISVLLRENDVVSCGHFEPLTEKTIVVAKFKHTVAGFVKMTQYGTSNWATGIPTEIYYSLSSTNETEANDAKVKLEWQFVTQDNVSCSNAPVYDPFRLNVSTCSQDVCAIGNAYRKSAPLVMNTRQHFIVDSLPLSGPYSILETSLRIRKTEGNRTTTECAPLLRFSEATFQWIAPSDLTLSQLQTKMVEKLDLDRFQVQFDYTRDPYRKRCSIYRVTILEEDWRLSEVLNMFNVEEKKFKSDAEFDCGEDVPTARSHSSSSSTTLFFILCYVIMLNS